MAESDNILTKLHDLLLYLIPQLGKFPRDQMTGNSPTFQRLVMTHILLLVGEARLMRAASDGNRRNPKGCQTVIGGRRGQRG
ncbi:MAG: hypothetical protein NT154_19255, partial [Verrucomicrobia bacterium]|nr:hypothetical protein [Verrucomicrobiota bacterium]